MVKQSIEPFTLDNNIIRFVDILSYTYMLIYRSISIYGIDGEEEETKIPSGPLHGHPLGEKHR